MTENDKPQSAGRQPSGLRGRARPKKQPTTTRPRDEGRGAGRARVGAAGGQHGPTGCAAESRRWSVRPLRSCSCPRTSAGPSPSWSGLGGSAMAFFGIADMLGTFDDPEDRVTARPEGAKLRPAVLELVTALAAWFVSLRLAVAGTLKWPTLTAAVLITGTFLWVVTAGFRAAQALGAFQTDETAQPRSLLKRHGFWLIVLTTLLYLPLLGSYSLSRPVGDPLRRGRSRDARARRLDLAVVGPRRLVLVQAGARFLDAGAVLLGARRALHARPDAGERGPRALPAAGVGGAHAACSCSRSLGVYFLYKGVAKACGRRAGLLGGIVLTTMPYWFLIAHQTMTDMPYVGPLTAAMGLLLLGFHTDPDERVGVYEISIGAAQAARLARGTSLFGAVVLLRPAAGALPRHAQPDAPLGRRAARLPLAPRPVLLGLRRWQLWPAGQRGLP